jgi:anaerobic magnesium-protoporphyrin IX monomethyl ester cyclase
MKVILCHTYFLEEDEHERQIMKPYPPLGLLYLNAYLRKHHFDAEVYDATFSSYPDLINYLEERKPDILGIHCNLLTKFNVMKLIKFCRQNDIVSILGGPDASTQVEEFLNHGADIIISGEGEEPLLDVLNRLQSKSRNDLEGIPNVSFKNKDGEIVQNPRQASKRSLNEYPYPDRSAIDMQKYLDVWETHHRQRPLSLVTARGCAFTCKWCSHSVYGWTHRRRSPENVLGEIKDIIQEYNPTHLWYADDVFTVNKHWIKNFHKLLVDEGIYLPFECIARADRMDDEMVALLKNLGCYRIWFGAESGSQRILDAMSRGVTKSEIENAIRWCQEFAIEAGVFVMFGYPGEKLSDVDETIKFISELQPDQYLTTIAYPLRGTTMYDEIKDQILYSNGWESHLQRELDFKERYTRPLYELAIKKLASEYRKKQLWKSRRQFLKQTYHNFRSAYCDYKMRRLENLRA